MDRNTDTRLSQYVLQYRFSISQYAFGVSLHPYYLLHIDLNIHFVLLKKLVY